MSWDTTDPETHHRGREDGGLESSVSGPLGRGPFRSSWSAGSLQWLRTGSVAHWERWWIPGRSVVWVFCGPVEGVRRYPDFLQGVGTLSCRTLGVLILDLQGGLTVVPKSQRVHSRTRGVRPVRIGRCTSGGTVDR